MWHFIVYYLDGKRERRHREVTASNSFDAVRVLLGELPPPEYVVGVIDVEQVFALCNEEGCFNQRNKGSKYCFVHNNQEKKS
jgi:hypothetical protein